MIVQPRTKRPTTSGIMSESTNRPRLRFSLRSLLVIMSLAAMLCWGGVTFYERRRYEANTMSLNLAIEGFNVIASADPIGSMEPKITGRGTGCN